MRLTQSLIENNGELTPELEQGLTANSANLANKVDAYAQVIERIDLEITSWKQQKADADAVLKRLEGAKERLRDSLKSSALALGETRLEGVYNKISVTPSKGRLVIDDAVLDKAYTRIVQTVEADKYRIRQALESGESVTGASIEPGHILRISKGSRLIK